MIAYEPFAAYERGVILELLSESYSQLLQELPAGKVAELLGDWREYDEAVFGEPGTVGTCGFVTSLSGEVIGFASWNPTKWPAVGIIGHNCILPKYRCRGYGRQQIREILRRFSDAGFKRAVVQTDEHPFFEPARRMYLKCGFEEVTRHPGVLLEDYAMIEYERRLGVGALDR
ncbi:MAG: GNAT family N-acetyltransferase [Gemmatimonadota bacterium]|nr:MAG: GNAT family N-acetyltransferase [Gemmatimonadota bacterium]